jgi:glycosyltransferase involved in cell wall biosynthesis
VVTSVVIAAHNEEAVLGRCLHRLLTGAEPDEFEVIVVANGSTDATTQVARAVRGVTVVELAIASKSAALNAGDAAATGFPRLYLDADIELTPAGVRALAAAVTGSDGAGQAVLAATPRRLLDTSGRPLLVRAYFAVNARLPAFRDALFGRGAIVVARAGRARFDRFPAMMADDLFLDSLFEAGEKREVAQVAIVVATPRRTRDLLRRLTRVRAGNSALRVAGERIRRPRRASWLVHVVLPRPWLLPAGVCYAALTLTAAFAARGATSRTAWGRDESTRTPAESRVR